MAEFQTYSPEDIIHSNLAETAKRFDAVSEQELAHLRELAVEIVAGVTEQSDFVSSLSDRIPPTSQCSSNILPLHEPVLNKLHGIRSAWQRVLLCMEIKRQLSQKMDLTPEFFFPYQEEVSVTAFQRVVYPKSSYADAAYLKFSSLMTVPRAAYAHSFLSACEDVYNGLCEFCILPIENSSEGQLSSFLRLIQKYELRIAATCFVSGTNRTGNTRFALLRKNVTPLLLPEKAPAYLEFAVPMDDDVSIADLLLAAGLCDLRLVQLDAFSQGEEDATPYTRLTFLAGDGDLQAFLLFLSMDIPHYEPIGLYSHIQDV